MPLTNRPLLKIDLPIAKFEKLKFLKELIIFFHFSTHRKSARAIGKIGKIQPPYLNFWEALKSSRTQSASSASRPIRTQQSVKVPCVFEKRIGGSKTQIFLDFCTKFEILKISKFAYFRQKSQYFAQYCKVFSTFHFTLLSTIWTQTLSTLE